MVLHIVTDLIGIQAKLLRNRLVTPQLGSPNRPLPSPKPLPKAERITTGYLIRHRRAPSDLATIEHFSPLDCVRTSPKRRIRLAPLEEGVRAARI